jgi:hypothetical protein
MVNLYSLKPTRERRPSLETGESEERFYENLLGKVLSVIAIPRDIPAVCYNPSLVPKDQLLESSQITLSRIPSFLQKLFIRIEGRRARPFIRGPVHTAFSISYPPIMSSRKM